MVAGNSSTISHHARQLSYEDACEIARTVLRDFRCRTTCLGLEEVAETSTAALAKLVALRRDLIKLGRDLRIVGLRGQANTLYEVARMGGLLPRQETQSPSGSWMSPAASSPAEPAVPAVPNPSAGAHGYERL